MESVRSKDGTNIAFERQGQGKPLIMLHGAGSDHRRFHPAASYLRDKYELILVDRRGRGASGDTSPYSIEREAEDIVAVIDQLNGSVFLHGYSSGAICALEASRLTDRIAKLALFEMPLRTDPDPMIDAQVAHLKTLLEAEDLEGVVEYQLSTFRKMNDDYIAAKKADTDGWNARLNNAVVLARDTILVFQQYSIHPERYTQRDIPLRFFVGTETTDHLKASLEIILSAMPRADVRWLKGLDHDAATTHPEHFSAAIVEFLG